MVQISETLLHTIRQYKMLLSGATVIVAVSGGADSMALLHALSQIQQFVGINLHVATLDHGLRPQAKQEVAVVVQFANQLGMPVTTGQVDCQALAAQWSMGIEAAARRARYQFLAEVAHTHHAAAVMTAHHADDQIETMLLHILRGSGLDGLRGMREVATIPDHPDIPLLRPLLSISREAIEMYCTQHQLPYFDDETNTDVKYMRNRIRHEILPSLEAINPQLRRSLYKLSEIASVETDYLQMVTTEMLDRYMVQVDSRFGIDRQAFSGFHSAIRRRILLELARKLEGEPEWDHIVHAEDVAIRGKMGAVAQFTGGIRLRVDYQRLWLEHEDTPLQHEDYLLLDTPKEVNIPGDTTLLNAVLTASLEPVPDAVCKVAVQPNLPLTIRTRLPGDRLQSSHSQGKSHKLKSVMIDRKIPRHLRHQIPLLVQEECILAVILPHQWIQTQPLIDPVISQRFIYFSVRRL